MASATSELIQKMAAEISSSISGPTTSQDDRRRTQHGTPPEKPEIKTTYLTSFEIDYHYQDYKFSTVDINKNIVLDKSQINLNQERNTQAIPFKIPRYWDNIDLVNDLNQKTADNNDSYATQMYIGFHYLNPENKEGISTPINVQYDDEYLYFYWLIDEYVTAVEGNIAFEILISGYHNGKPYIWRSRPNRQINILPALTTGIEIDPDNQIHPSQGWDNYLSEWQGLIDKLLEYYNNLSVTKDWFTAIDKRVTNVELIVDEESNNELFLVITVESDAYNDPNGTNTSPAYRQQFKVNLSDHIVAKDNLDTIENKLKTEIEEIALDLRTRLGDIGIETFKEWGINNEILDGTTVQTNDVGVVTSIKTTIKDKEIDFFNKEPVAEEGKPATGYKYKIFRFNIDNLFSTLYNIKFDTNEYIHFYQNILLNTDEPEDTEEKIILTEIYGDETKNRIVFQNPVYDIPGLEQYFNFSYESSITETLGKYYNNIKTKLDKSYIKTSLIDNVFTITNENNEEEFISIFQQIDNSGKTIPLGIDNYNFLKIIYVSPTYKQNDTWVYCVEVPVKKVNQDMYSSITEYVRDVDREVNEKIDNNKIDLDNQINDFKEEINGNNSDFQISIAEQLTNNFNDAKKYIDDSIKDLNIDDKLNKEALTETLEDYYATREYVGEIPQEDRDNGVNTIIQYVNYKVASLDIISPEDLLIYIEAEGE